MTIVAVSILLVWVGSFGFLLMYLIWSSTCAEAAGGYKVAGELPPDEMRSVLKYAAGMATCVTIASTGLAGLLASAS